MNELNAEAGGVSRDRFLVCPKCLAAYPAEVCHSYYTCRFCQHEWQPPINALGSAYFAQLDDVSVFLTGSLGEKFLLNAFPAIIGRDSDFKILQHNVSVSRRHCTINYDHAVDQFTVTPFKTGGGTYLNGQVLQPEVAYPLHPGDALVLSGVVLSMRCELTAEKSERRQSAKPISSIALSACDPMGFVVLPAEGEPCISADVNANVVAAFMQNSKKNVWSVLAVQRQKVTLNGNIFVEGELIGGENLTINGLCYVFNAAKMSLEPRDPDCGAGIDIKKLKVGYSGTTILGDITCRIPQGKLTAILGQSGCGKSTLIKVLSGQKCQKSGQISVAGNSTHNYAQWATQHVSLVPQHDVVHAELTVKQCIEYAADIRIGKKVGAQLKEALVDKVIREAGLEHYTSCVIASLSGGQRKRVNVAVEAVGRPEVLLLDEPTTGLDYATEKQITAGLRQMSRQGKTIVFVTHSLATLEAADHVIVLTNTKDGSRVAAEGTPAEVQRAIGVESWEELYSNISRVSAKNNTTLVESQVAYRAPGMSALFSRYLALWINSPISSMALLFGLPLLLGLMTRFAVSAIDTPEGNDRLVFGLVAMFWLGMNQTVREIVKEKHIFLQEHANHVSSWSYLLSKLCFFLMISLPQSLLMTIPILWLNVNADGFLLCFGQLTCPFYSVLPMMWAAGFIGCTLGLLFSALSLFVRHKGEIAAVLLAVIATLPQFLYSNKVLPGGLADSMKPEHYYTFVRWHMEHAPLAEFLSYFTFSRYLFVPLNAISTGQPIAVIKKAFIFNGGILAIAAVIMIIISWLLLELYSWKARR